MGSSSNEEEEQKISQSQRNFRSHSKNGQVEFSLSKRNFAIIAKICTVPLKDKMLYSVFIFILFLFYFIKKTFVFYFYLKKII